MVYRLIETWSLHGTAQPIIGGILGWDERARGYGSRHKAGIEVNAQHQTADNQQNPQSGGPGEV